MKRLRTYKPPPQGHSTSYWLTHNTLIGRSRFSQWWRESMYEEIVILSPG